MAAGSEIDSAFRRAQILTLILERLRNEAVGKPTEKRWTDFGILEVGEKAEEASKKIEKTFDELLSLLNHVAILDMAASFERASRARIGTRIGEARSSLKEGLKKRPLPAYYARLVYDLAAFDGLKSIGGLLENHLAAEFMDKIDAVRDSRNTFAHGTSLQAGPKIDREEAREALNLALGLL